MTPAPTDSPHLAETQLVALWQGRRFPAGALVTRSGVPVRLIHQGQRGRGPGPDFRAAEIAGLSGVPLRGDIELHVRSSDFRSHGHHRDPAYAGLILHVVFHDDTGADTPLPGGGTAPVVALAPWVARRADELQRWLERPLLWREPCHDAVQRLGMEGVQAALEAEGDRRFHRKVERARECIDACGLVQAVYEALLEALGYQANAPPMRALAELLPWSRLDTLAGHGPDRRLRVEALLIGSAGLLPGRRGHAVPWHPCVEHLEATFVAAQVPALEAPAENWKLRGIRPQNAPARRLAAAAALLAPLSTPADLLALAGAATASDAVRPMLLAADGYWRDHYDPCAGPCRLPPGLLGRSRALEIILNVVLPMAAAADAAPFRDVLRLFATLPRPSSYGATRFLEATLAAEGPRTRINARRAQGMLELTRNWCTQGGCGRCVLSAR